MVEYKCPSCFNLFERYQEFSIWYDCRHCNIELWIGLHKTAIYNIGCKNVVATASNFEECCKKFKLRSFA